MPVIMAEISGSLVSNDERGLKLFADEGKTKPVEVRSLAMTSVD